MISENAKEENGKAKKGRRKKGTGTEAERRETKTGCGSRVIMPKKISVIMPKISAVLL